MILTYHVLSETFVASPGDMGRRVVAVLSSRHSETGLRSRVGTGLTRVDVCDYTGKTRNDTPQSLNKKHFVNLLMEVL